MFKTGRIRMILSKPILVDLNTLENNNKKNTLDLSS